MLFQVACSKTVRDIDPQRAAAAWRKVVWNKIRLANIITGMGVGFRKIQSAYISVGKMLICQSTSDLKALCEVPSSIAKIEDIIASIHQKHSEASHELQLANQPLVWSIVSREPHHAQDSLFSAGNVGLLLAIDDYDLSVGAKFGTYATWRIRQHINLSLIHI